MWTYFKSTWNVVDLIFIWVESERKIPFQHTVAAIFIIIITFYRLFFLFVIFCWLLLLRFFSWLFSCGFFSLLFCIDWRRHIFYQNHFCFASKSKMLHRKWVYAKRKGIWQKMSRCQSMQSESEIKTHGRKRGKRKLEEKNTKNGQEKKAEKQKWIRYKMKQRETNVRKENWNSKPEMNV